MVNMIQTGDVLEHIRHEYSDCEVVETLTNAIAVQFVNHRKYNSYTPVIVELSLNSVEMQMTTPLYWYKKDEFLKIYQLKDKP